MQTSHILLKAAIHYSEFRRWEFWPRMFVTSAYLFLKRVVKQFNQIPMDPLSRRWHLTISPLATVFFLIAFTNGAEAVHLLPAPMDPTKQLTAAINAYSPPGTVLTNLVITPLSRTDLDRAYKFKATAQTVESLYALAPNSHPALEPIRDVKNRVIRAKARMRLIPEEFRAGTNEPSLVAMNSTFLIELTTNGTLENVSGDAEAHHNNRFFGGKWSVRASQFLLEKIKGNRITNFASPVVLGTDEANAVIEQFKMHGDMVATQANNCVQGFIGEYRNKWNQYFQELPEDAYYEGTAQQTRFVCHLTRSKSLGVQFHLFETIHSKRGAGSFHIISDQRIDRLAAAVDADTVPEDSGDLQMPSSRPALNISVDQSISISPMEFVNQKAELTELTSDLITISSPTGISPMTLKRISPDQVDAQRRKFDKERAELFGNFGPGVVFDLTADNPNDLLMGVVSNDGEEIKVSIRPAASDGKQIPKSRLATFALRDNSETPSIEITAASDAISGPAILGENNPQAVAFLLQNKPKLFLQGKIRALDADPKLAVSESGNILPVTIYRAVKKLDAGGKTGLFMVAPSGDYTELTAVENPTTHFGFTLSSSAAFPTNAIIQQIPGDNQIIAYKVRGHLYGVQLAVQKDGSYGYETPMPGDANPKKSLIFQVNTEKIDNGLYVVSTGEAGVSLLVLEDQNLNSRFIIQR